MPRIDEAYILVIEDNADNLMVAMDFLQLMGVKYANARASGWQGLKLAESMPQLDLILLDIQIPHEDGFAILQRIRARPKLKHTRVIAVTANVLPEHEARARPGSMALSASRWIWIASPSRSNRFSRAKRYGWRTDLHDV